MFLKGIKRDNGHEASCEENSLEFCSKFLVNNPCENALFQRRIQNSVKHLIHRRQLFSLKTPS